MTIPPNSHPEQVELIARALAAKQIDGMMPGLPANTRESMIQKDWAGWIGEAEYVAAALAKPNFEQAVVTKADISAAIDLKFALDDAGSTSWSLRASDPSKHPVAIAFARHRLASLANRPADDGELLRTAVRNILPIGNNRLPGDRVIPIYVRMDELRALHALAASPQPEGVKQP